MKIQAVINPKGGVGKSTSAVNLAVLCAQAGNKVLVIDLDPQGSASTLLGVDRCAAGAAQIFEDGFNELKSIVHLTEFGLDLVPASTALSVADDQIRQAPLGELRLSHAIKRSSANDEYDYCFIDTAGSAGRIYSSVGIAADDIIVPINASALSANVVPEILQSIASLSSARPQMESLVVRGVFFNMVDQNTMAAQMNMEEVRQYLANQHVRVLSNVVSRSTKVEQAALGGMPLVCFDPKAKVSQDFGSVYRELFS